MEKKKTKGKIILIVVVVFLAIGVVSGIVNNLTGSTETAQSTEPTDEKSSAEKVLENNSDIIWKDDENIGILNLELDGTKTKQGIIAEYYTSISEYLKTIDKANLGDYDYIQFAGNVMKDGKIDCTIKGNLTLEFIKTSDDLSPAHLESNMQELFIPKPLQ